MDKEKAYKALSESEERYRIILDMSFDGIFVHEHFKILDLSESMIKLTGYSHAELFATLAIDLFTPKSQELVRNYVNSGSAGIYEVELIKKDGSIRQVESFGAPCNFQGRDARIVGIRDITDQKEALKEIKKRVKELEDFYDIAIGRELRMIELKDTIKELEKELEKYEHL